MFDMAALASWISRQASQHGEKVIARRPHCGVLKPSEYALPRAGRNTTAIRPGLGECENDDWAT